MNTKSVLFALQDFFMFTAVTTITLLVVLYYLGNQEREFLHFLFFLHFLYYLPSGLFPVLFLFLNYEQNDAGKKICLSKDLVIINSEKIKDIEIKKIIIYGARQHFHKSFGLLPHSQDFFYMEIMLLDKRKHYVTCLVSPEIDKEFKEALPGVKFVDRIKFFPKI